MRLIIELISTPAYRGPTKPLYEVKLEGKRIALFEFRTGEPWSKALVLAANAVRIVEKRKNIKGGL